jgi:acyl-CoA dehydrogenase
MEHQSYAYGRNHFRLDPDLPTLLGRYWRGWEAYRGELEAFGY